jgi:hypothetical protein
VESLYRLAQTGTLDQPSSRAQANEVAPNDH